MKNTVTASIEFYFKGEKHSPAVDLDLDELLTNHGCIPDLYSLIATANNYDTYSYEFEMMQAEPIYFSNAQGLVASFIHQGSLDSDAFITAWLNNQVTDKLLEIARQNMGIDDFSDHLELKQALLAAYRLGQQNID